MMERNTNDLITYWEQQLMFSLKAVEVAQKNLERLYNHNQLTLELGKLAVAPVVVADARTPS